MFEENFSYGEGVVIEDNMGEVVEGTFVTDLEVPDKDGGRYIISIDGGYFLARDVKRIEKPLKEKIGDLRSMFGGTLEDAPETTNRGEVPEFLRGLMGMDEDQEEEPTAEIILDNIGEVVKKAGPMELIEAMAIMESGEYEEGKSGNDLLDYMESIPNKDLEKAGMRAKKMMKQRGI